MSTDVQQGYGMQNQAAAQRGAAKPEKASGYLGCAKTKQLGRGTGRESRSVRYSGTSPAAAGTRVSPTFSAVPYPSWPS